LAAIDTTVPETFHAEAERICHFTICHITRGTCETLLTENLSRVVFSLDVSFKHGYKNNTNDHQNKLVGTVLDENVNDVREQSETRTSFTLFTHLYS
jgi:hypothetical protein